MNEKIALQLFQDDQIVIPKLILKNYYKLGMTAEEFVFLLELDSSLTNCNQGLDIQSIAKIMGKDEAQIYQLLHGLIEKGIVSLTSVVDEHGQNADCYSLTPLYKKTIKLLNENEIKHQKQTNFQKQTDIFNRIEHEFGHPLSSFDMEMIESWLKDDHYTPEIIILALKEAVLSGVYNLKYMDKILLSWGKKGIKTAADVQQERSKFRGKRGIQRKQEGNHVKPKIPLNKWSNLK